MGGSIARDVSVPLLAALIGTGGGIWAAHLGLVGTNREMDVKMVEIAIGLLSQEQKESIAPAREWAVDVISFYSAPEVKPSESVREALTRHKAVLLYPDYVEFSSEFSGEFGRALPGTNPRANREAAQ